MSAINSVARLDNIQQMIHLAEPDFNKLAQIHGAVSFNVEASFAHEILKNSDYLTKVAVGNPDSLKRAILNVATIGLSLSPVTKLAYLVPRKGKICLDISYRGYVQLAVDAKAIKWAMAEVVYEKDRFEVRGLGQEPLHHREPFAPDRGEPVGAYCVAKTHDDEFITTTMSYAEIVAIRNRSEAWMAYEKDKSKTNPWLTDGSEMAKKTVIRRAWKSWPITDTRRLDEAIEVGSQADPLDFNAPLPAIESSAREKSLNQMRDMLQALDETEFAFAQHSTRVCKREIKKLEDMTDPEIKAANAMLSQMIDKKNAEVKS